MSTQKVAITIPKQLVAMIDMIVKQHGLSRSRYIFNVLREKLTNEKAQTTKEAYNKIFSDNKIRKEQIEIARWFEGSGRKEGQEW